MKILLLFTFLLAFCLIDVEARVLTVSNNTAIPAQYASLDDAYSAATNGDTLIFAGSSTSYSIGTFVLNKRLTLIGSGIKPSTLTGLPAYFSNFDCDSSSAGNSRGSRFIGLIFSTLHINRGVNDIQVSDCQFTNFETREDVGNFIIRNSILGAILGGAFSIYTTSKTVTVAHCILRGTLSGGSSQTLITNNLFIGSTDAFLSFGNAIIANNLFVGKTPQGASNATFSNNLTYITNNNTLPYGNNTGGGNLIGQNPQFVFSSNADYDIGHDYRLQAGSPAKNAGTDGMDIGPTGGTYPWYQQLSFDGPLPVVQEINILNGSVLPTGNLQVRIKAQKGR